MFTGGKWNILEHLLDDSGTKSNQRGVLAKALYEAKKSSSEEEGLERLAPKCLTLRTVADDAAYSVYKEMANSALDEPLRSAKYAVPYKT